MQLHHIQSRTTRKREKTRVGRGGKRGTSAGHGTKGQKSRAGHRIRPAERDFIQRLPKLRGFKNKSQAVKPSVVNLSLLESKIKGSHIDPVILLKAGLIRRAGTVKILGGGELKRAFTFRAVTVSKTAQKKIEAVGGKIEK